MTANICFSWSRAAQYSIFPMLYNSAICFHWFGATHDTISPKPNDRVNICFHWSGAAPYTISPKLVDCLFVCVEVQSTFVSIRLVLHIILSRLSFITESTLLPMVCSCTLYYLSLARVNICFHWSGAALYIIFP